MVREHDTVARVGGDEFIVLLENLSNEEKAELYLQNYISKESDCQDI